MAMVLTDAQSYVLSQINQFFGPVPEGVNAAPIQTQRMALANSIASLVTYIQQNADVKAGIPIANPAGLGATTAPGVIE